MIQDIKKDCVFYASRLGDYQAMTPDQLMNGYVEALDEGDKVKQSKYLAAVVLRYWYTIGKKFLKDGKALKLEIEDCYTYLVEAINLAAKYRGWLKPEKNVNAQTCILQALNTIYVRAYYVANLDKNSTNYRPQLSFDTSFMSSTGDGTHLVTLKDMLEDEQYTQDQNYDESAENAKHYIQKMIDAGKLVEAIILDQVAFGDTMREKVTKSSFIDENGNKVRVSEKQSEFWAHKLVKNLTELDDGYKKYFTDTYKVGIEPLNATLSKISKANNQKLYRYMRACFANCQKSAKKALLG